MTDASPLQRAAEYPSARQLLSDTLQIPGQVRVSLERIFAMVEETLSPEEAKGAQKVFLAGSGDLHNVALVSEVAFERFAGFAAEGMTSMQFGLYASPTVPSGSVLIQMNFSGKTSRAIESATLGRKAGARVWTIVNDPDTPLARLGHLQFVNPLLGSNEAAGYPTTMLTVYSIALRLGELTGRLSQSRAEELRRELTRSAECMEATLKLCDPLAKEMGERWKSGSTFVFLGAGPNFGTAMNSAARVVEAVGAHAFAQDIEEWIHLFRFTREKDTPSFVIAPPGPSRQRAGEVLQVMGILERPSVAIVEEHDTELRDRVSEHLPVCCDLCEEFSPLVYNLPGEMVADYLALASGAHPFRADDPIYSRIGEVRQGGFIHTSLPL